MALESLFLRLETFPGCLCGAEIKTLQMRPSQPKSEVVTNRRIFQKPPCNQKIFQLPCTKMALEAKPWVRMSLETTQNDRQDLPKKCHPGNQNLRWSQIGGFFKNRPPHQKWPKKIQIAKNQIFPNRFFSPSIFGLPSTCLLYTSDAADE